MESEKVPFLPVLKGSQPDLSEGDPESLTQRVLQQAIDLAKANKQLDVDRKELQKAEDQIRSLAKFPRENPNPVLRIGGDGKLLYANPPAVELMELISSTLGGEVTSELRDLALQSLGDGEHHDLEVILGDKIFTLELSPILDEGYVNVYGRDVTQIRLAEGQIALQYDLVKIFAEAETLEDAMPKILGIVGRFLKWELAYFWEVVPDGEALRCRCGWRSSVLPDNEALRQFEQATWESAFRRGDGLPGRVWARKEPAWIPDLMQDANFPRRPHAARLEIGMGFGLPIVSPSGFVGVIEVFTRRTSQSESAHFDFMASLGSQIGQFVARKRAELDVLAERKSLYEILNTLPVALHTVDADGSIPFANRAFEERFGDPQSPACKEMLKNRVPLSGNFPKSNPFSASDGEVVFWRGPGEAATLSFQTRFPEGQYPARTLEMSLDMTQQCQAENRLQLYAKELERSNRELEDFASIASHDLKEPLRKILTFGECLGEKNDQLDSVGREYLGRMLKAAASMRTLIQDLLAFARVSRKEGALEPVDLEKVIDRVLEGLEVPLKETGARVEVRSLPRVQADPLHMRQLFQNLIGNSLKYHRTGVAPRIRIEAVTTAAGNREIHLEDNGIGFKEKFCERIFKPFERLHSKSVYEGSGMGLAICWKIMARYGGTIRAEGRPDCGAKFILHFPEHTVS